MGNDRKHSDVFISFSTVDKELADLIVKDFEENGLACWYAPRDILPGETWAEALSVNIRNSSIFLFLFTEASNNSVFVLKEVAYAVESRKPILPARFSDIQMSDSLQFYLGNVQCMEAFGQPVSVSLPYLRARAQAMTGKEFFLPITPVESKCDESTTMKLLKYLERTTQLDQSSKEDFFDGRTLQPWETMNRQMQENFVNGKTEEKPYLIQTNSKTQEISINEKKEKDRTLIKRAVIIALILVIILVIILF